MLKSSPVTLFDDFARMEADNWARQSLAAEYVGRFAQAADQSIPAVLSAISPMEGRRTLDVCCGQGSLSQAIASAGAEVIGLDFSDAMLDVARKSTGNVVYKRGDAQNLPFHDEEFDIVVSGFGICHLPDQPRALREAHRVLRKGGRFAFTVWCGPDQSDSFRLLYSAIKNLGDSSVTLPPGPDFHQFAHLDTASCLLAEAKFHSIALKIVNCSWDFDRPEDLCIAFEKATARASVLLANQPRDKLEAIRVEMANRIRNDYRVGDRFRVPVPVALVSATK